MIAAEDAAEAGDADPELDAVLAWLEAEMKEVASMPPRPPPPPLEPLVIAPDSPLGKVLALARVVTKKRELLVARFELLCEHADPESWPSVSAWMAAHEDVLVAAFNVLDGVDPEEPEPRRVLTPGQQAQKLARAKAEKKAPAIVPEVFVRRER